ncbi:unnamed protein product [Pieris brassicae]|uniref:Uncharacterized protein n=1 Tax=Pieris brassicae TaxID=7116 RepID=A0A9P0XCR5_PIEBR|nr:unnamed protein product [Pieris brassicae]
MSRLSLFLVFALVVMAFAEDASSAAPSSASPASPATTPMTPATPKTTPKPDKAENIITGLVKAAYDIPKGFFDACSDFKKAVFGGFF